MAQNFAIFNEAFYLSKNPDIADAVRKGIIPSGLQHFQQYGLIEGRSVVSPFYDEAAYLGVYPDIADAARKGAFRSGLQHFINSGFDEGRTVKTSGFDETVYLGANPDVAVAVRNGAFKSGLQHFINFGLLEGRSAPVSTFNETEYLAAYPDIAAAVSTGAFKSAQQHYLLFGKAEGRSADPGFDIKFDYRFDITGFFNDPNRRAILETAGNIWEGIIKDEFPEVPAGTEFTVLNPSTGQNETVKLTEPIDDLLIFVGAQSPPFGLPQPAIAQAGPSSLQATPGDYSFRTFGSNFEPFAGNISFNPNPEFLGGTPAAWFFDSTPNTRNDIPLGSYDFLSVSLHEIARILGINSIPAFNALISGDSFIGPRATAANGGIPIPLDRDRYLVREGSLTDTSQILLMGDSARNSVLGSLPTAIDIAMLADIGYQV